MRMIWRGLGLSALVLAALAASNGTLRAADQPVVHVTSVVKDGGVRLEAQANAPFDYTTYRPSESLFVLDFSGVSAGDSDGARILASDLVKSYRLVPYSAGNRPMVRLEVLLARGLQPKLEKTDSQNLVLTVARSSESASRLRTAVPSMVPAAAKSVVSGGNSMVSSGFIRNVTIAEDSGSTEVNILTSSPLNYHPMQLQNPDRLVLDFSSARLAAPLKQLASNLDPVRAVRVAQYTPQTSRVVIDLRQPSTYNINTSGNTVTVSFSASASGTRTTAPASMGASSVSTTQLAQPAPVSHASSQVAQVPAPSVALPNQLTHPSAALAAQDGGQIQMGGVMSAVRGAGSSSSSSGSAGAPPSTFSPATSYTGGSQAAATPAPSTRYSGDPISVNLKDVDLADFFRLIHEISGLNVVVDPTVHGSLTIVLDNVPWDQALDIVLRNNDLDKQLDGNVLRIVTKATMKAEAQEAAELARLQAEASEVVTTTRVLSYAKATEVTATLKKFLSARGDILSDDRSNTLIIRDVPTSFPVIDNLLRQLDKKSQQVEIEARVVSASRAFARDLGSILGVSGAATKLNPFGGLNNNNAFSGDSNVGASPGFFAPCPPVFIGSTCAIPTAGSTATNVQIPLLTNLGANAPTSGIAYMFQSANFALDAVIDAAESKGVGKLLSAPKIITQNNEKGTARDGVKIPVQTVVNNTVSVQFVNATLELNVTPQITADGTVFMDVIVENDQIDNGIPRIQGIPAIDTQSAETKVTVNDGATVVIGGMTLTNQQTNVNEVPLFGSLPVIGNLFKHTAISTTSSELLFFITPRILPN